MLRPALGLLLALIVSPEVSAAEIVPLAGKPIKGTILGVDPLFVTYKDDANAEVKIPVKDMSSVELGPKAPTLAEVAYDEIELTDGSLLRTVPGSAKFKLKKIEPGSLPGPTGTDAPTVDVPLNAIFVLLRDAQKPIAEELGLNP